MKRYLISTLVVVALTPVACTSSGTTAPTETRTVTVVIDDETLTVEQPVGCATGSGSPIDIASEPAQWLAFAEYERWFDADGCPVRIDVISHVHGSAHCDWQDAQFITIGRPLGTSVDHLSPESANRYVWDPNDVLDGITADRTIAVMELPGTVTPTGFSQRDAALWLDDADESVLYVVDGDTAAVWKRDFDAGLCS